MTITHAVLLLWFALWMVFVLRAAVDQYRRR
jgi:hypothetical protein